MSNTPRRSAQGDPQLFPASPLLSAQVLHLHQLQQLPRQANRLRICASAGDLHISGVKGGVFSMRALLPASHRPSSATRAEACRPLLPANRRSDGPFLNKKQPWPPPAAPRPGPVGAKFELSHLLQQVHQGAHAPAVYLWGLLQLLQLPQHLAMVAAGRQERLQAMGRVGAAALPGQERGWPWEPPSMRGQPAAASSLLCRLWAGVGTGLPFHWLLAGCLGMA